MTWFKVDDSLHSHRKALRAGAEAMGLWVMAGSWVGAQLTDGFVPTYVARQFAADVESVAARLVSAGLWEPGVCDGDEGWWFRDWLEFNPSKEKVLDDRRKDAEKKAKMRAALAEKRRKGRSTRPRGTPAGTPQGSPAQTPEGSPSLPDPGSLPSSGTPASGGRGAERPPAREVARPVEHRPTASEAVRAEARAELDRKVPRSRRHEGRRPLLLSVQSDRPRSRSRAEVERDEQDRMAELEAMQAPPVGRGGAPPDSGGGSDSCQDQREQGTG